MHWRGGCNRARFWQGSEEIGHVHNAYVDAETDVNEHERVQRVEQSEIVEEDGDRDKNHVWGYVHVADDENEHEQVAHEFEFSEGVSSENTHAE